MRNLFKVTFLLLSLSCNNLYYTDVRNLKLQTIEELNEKYCLIMFLSEGSKFRDTGGDMYLFDEDIRIYYCNDSLALNSICKKIKKLTKKNIQNIFDPFMQPGIVSILMSTNGRKFNEICEYSNNPWFSLIKNAKRRKIKNNEIEVIIYKGKLFKLYFTGYKGDTNVNYIYYTIPFCKIKADTSNVDHK